MIANIRSKGYNNINELKVVLLLTMKAYFSNRVYKNTLDETLVEDVQHTLLTFNQAKHFRFQAEIREKRNVKIKPETSIHLRVKAQYNLNDYYANSAVQEGKALITAQQELTKMYIANKKEQVNATKRKNKTIKSSMNVLKKIKNSLVKGKPRFNKNSREQLRGNYFVVQFKSQTDLYYNAYDFEHIYIDKEIRELTSRSGQLDFRIDRLEKQIKSLKNDTKSVCFGSKKLAKARLTTCKYQDNPELWQEDWHLARYGKMTISGRKDAKYGNFVFQYNPDNHKLIFKAINGNVVVFENLLFPYGQENINDTINTQVNLKNKSKFGKPVSWTIEDHGPYYIVKCLIDVAPNLYTNHLKETGVIGVDLNVDHLAVSNVNSIGQLIESFILKFDILNKTSDQTIKIIEAEAIKLVDYAVAHNKLIVLEKLDMTQSKAKNPYGNRKANRLMSGFAYDVMRRSIKSRADKMGIEVYEVNPAYTSQIGKIKYMKRLGISIHQAASYVIARRAMGFKEKLPPALYSLVPEQKRGLHHWAHWVYVSKSLSKVRQHSFYQIERSHSNRLYPSWMTLFPQEALKDFEKMGLFALDRRKSKA